MAKKQNTIKKHKAVIDYFNNLYDIKRKRYDDCLKETAERFFYSISSVEDILRAGNKMELQEAS